MPLFFCLKAGNIFVSNASARALTPRQAGLSDIGIVIDMTATRAFYFNVVFPEFDLRAAFKAFPEFNVFGPEIGRIHSGASEFHCFLIINSYR